MCFYKRVTCGSPPNVTNALLLIEYNNDDSNNSNNVRSNIVCAIYMYHAHLTQLNHLSPRISSSPRKLQFKDAQSSTC